jgi:hypothetical protein
MSFNVPYRLAMSQNVAECRTMSPKFAECRTMSPKFAECRLTSQIVAKLHMTSQNVSATFGDIMLQLKLSPGAHGTSPGSLIWTKHDLIVRNPVCVFCLSINQKLLIRK